MTPLADTQPRCVVLIGNPNTGKSTVFSALSGLRQQVGNYPGVTVEKKIGRFSVEDKNFILIDLPGTYSLTPRSPDELVTLEVLTGRQPGVRSPDILVCVVDASNLERNLLLVNQLMSLGLPVVIALNMNDVAERHGITIDVSKLQANLGLQVVPVHAPRRIGMDDLKRCLAATKPTSLEADGGASAELVSLVDALHDSWPSEPPSRFLIERLVMSAADSASNSIGIDVPPNIQEQLEEIRVDDLQQGSLVKSESITRYAWVEERLRGVIHHNPTLTSFSDRVDRVLMHPWGGLLVALATMLVMFQAVFTIAGPASAMIDLLTGAMSSAVESIVPSGALQSLLVEGLIGGVGGVLVFLPQIFLLFFFLALLEDSGYLARIACLMDNLMSNVGLSGKSFIPLLSSFACAIPGIMAARTIQNPRDRLVTILIAPLMTCSARLPVYTLLIAAFIPDKRYWGGLLGLQGLTMLSLFLLGILTAVVVAALLRKFVLPGHTPDFLLELPTYKLPAAGMVARKVWDGGYEFVKGAGTLIVAVTVLVWAAAYYPHNDRGVDQDLLRQRDSLVGRVAARDDRPDRSLATQLVEIENRINGQRMQHSFLGRAGRAIEPLVKPLGWDWRIGCAVIASFPAREVVVATLGVLYKLGDGQDEASESLRDTLRESTWDGTDKPVFNIPVALSVMVFFALCAQCVSTLAVMRRETNSWRWPVFSFVYMTVLAYVGAWITFRVGTLLLG